MISSEQLRHSLILPALGAALLAGVAYDSLFVQTGSQFQVPLAGVIALSLAYVFFLVRYPSDSIQPAIVAAWPLHLFTLAFFWSCFAVHGGRKLDQVVSYTLFAYATYLLVPLVLLLDRRIFIGFVKMIAVVCALLAVPSFVGAAGIESFLGIPMKVKFSYAQFSGIAASAGFFEHAEGHAFQMAIGILCSWYAWRQSGSRWFVVTLLLALGGLIVSQGRAAIYGIGVATLFAILPELFRRSRPIFLITLVGVLTAPYLVLPQLKAVPGVAGYFRLERGLSGRGEAWRFALKLVEEKPWTGHGFMASTEFTEDQRKQLRKSGFSGAGTTFHNTFLTKAVDMGVVVTGIYCLLYLIPLFHVCQPTRFALEQTLVRSMVLLTLTASIYRDYNIGGIRSTAMIGAMFLGVANMWPWVLSWHAPRETTEGASRELEGSPPQAWQVRPTT